jgi:hypothetical protein
MGNPEHGSGVRISGLKKGPCAGPEEWFDAGLSAGAVLRGGLPEGGEEVAGLEKSQGLSKERARAQGSSRAEPSLPNAPCRAEAEGAITRPMSEFRKFLDYRLPIGVGLWGLVSLVPVLVYHAPLSIAGSLGWAALIVVTLEAAAAIIRRTRHT